MASGIKWRLVICIFCAVLNLRMVLTSQEVITKLTTGFSKVLEQCKTELNAGDHIMKDFYNFWREEYELVNRDLGCMVMCMASKLELVGEDFNLHHGKAHEFAKKHGADDALAKQLLTILHDCETSSQSVEDPCIKVLGIAKCFKSKIHELKWAPSMEVVLEEIMTAV